MKNFRRLIVPISEAGRKSARRQELEPARGACRRDPGASAKGTGTSGREAKDQADRAQQVRLLSIERSELL